MERVKSKSFYNPLATLCDTVPQFNRAIPSILLKKSTGDLIHEAYLNGSICKYRDMYLFAYRTDQRPWCTQPRIHIVQVDETLIPISNNITLTVATNKQAWRVDYTGQCNADSGQRAEDPRLVVVGDDLFIFWTDGFKLYYGQLDLVIDNNNKVVDASIRQVYTPKPPYVEELLMDPKYDGREKNWTPFDRDGQLWIIYCFEPFICCRLRDGVITETVRHDDVFLNWKHGFVKGGTPAILWKDNEYITIFHSSIRDKTGINYYYAGALTFDQETLKPTQVSRYPIIAPYPDSDCKRPNTSYVIFPCGLLMQDDLLLISYGYNDHTVKVHASSRKAIDYNLGEVSDRLHIRHTVPELHNPVPPPIDSAPSELLTNLYHP